MHIIIMTYKRSDSITRWLKTAYFILLFTARPVCSVCPDKSPQSCQKMSKLGLSFIGKSNVKLIDWHILCEHIIHKYQQSKENMMAVQREGTLAQSIFLLLTPYVEIRSLRRRMEIFQTCIFLLCFSTQVFVLAVENTNIQDFLGTYYTTLQQLNIVSWQLT